MKPNMHILSDRLSKFDKQVSIKDGTGELSGVRFFSGELPRISPDFVYIGNAHEVMLLNRHDMILVKSQAIEDVINEVLSAFDFFSTWEASLAIAAGSTDGIGKVLESVSEILRARVLLSDLSGNIISMSQSCLSAKGEFWDSVTAENKISLAVISEPAVNSDGEHIFGVTTAPAIYKMTDGTTNICAHICIDGENVALIAAQEYEKPLTAGDCQIVSTAIRHLSPVLSSHPELQSTSAAFSAMLDGKGEMNTAKLPDAPWVLVSVRSCSSPEHDIVRGILCKQVMNFKCRCIPAVYGKELVVLLSHNTLEGFLDELRRAIDERFYSVGISLIFSSLKEIRSRYNQAIFALNKFAGSPGIYDAAALAFDYLMDRVWENNLQLGFKHPILEQLHAYDKCKDSELLNTLIVYLKHERNASETARELLIHRNTLTKRIELIEELTKVDLNSPDERLYILLSHRIN